MQIKPGYLYHIKDEFFKKINDENLMSNREFGKQRPTYFVIKEKNIIWFIPLSSKVDKYQKIYDKKVKKYGSCNTIMIEQIFNKKCVILLQNAFPTLEKYIDHIHTINGIAAKVPITLDKKILKNFKELMKLKNNGINLFFTNIDSITQQILKEINA